MTITKHDFIGIASIVAALLIGLNLSLTVNLEFSPIEHLSWAAGFLGTAAVLGLLIGIIAQKFFSQQLLVSAGVATLLLAFASAGAQSNRQEMQQSYEQCVLQEMKHQPAMTTVLNYAMKVCKEKTGT